jgi:acyl carrier protein
MEEAMENTLSGTADVVKRIKQMLAEDLQLKVVPEEIPDDYSLLEGGLALDSILISELIAQIEDRFGLQFDDRVLEAEVFDNLSVLAAFVARECEAVRAAAGDIQAGGATC